LGERWQTGNDQRNDKVSDQFANGTIVPPTKIELIRRIACLADNQMNTIFTEEMNIVGVAGSWGSGSKFIVASIINNPGKMSGIINLALLPKARPRTNTITQPRRVIMLLPPSPTWSCCL
jgi:hypothetical protein